MARTLFGLESGVRLYDINADTFVDIIFGAAAPGGDTGVQDDASIGSIYQRTDGQFYRKVANAGAAADWTPVPAGTLSGGYLGNVNGTPIPGDALELAISKLDANQRDLTTLTGVLQGAVDLGIFSGNVISDNVTIKAALQELETYVEGISGGAQITVTGVTTLQDIDTVLVDDVQQVEWEYVVFEEATPANKKSGKLMAIHNGTAAADATLTDDTNFAKLKLGANFNLVLTVDLNGAAGTQTMRLRASSSTAGVTINVRRTIIN